MLSTLTGVLWIFWVACCWVRPVDAFVPPASKTARSTSALALDHTTWTDTLAVASNLADAHKDSWLVLAAAIVSATPLLSLAMQENEEKEQERDETEGTTMTRRNTLQTLVGGAVGWVASDALLGAAGNLLTGTTRSTIFGAQWNPLYRRVAAQAATHGEAAVATPEFLAWVAQSPAALMHPELRAWMAAQQALGKAAAAVVAEEGMAVGTVAVAAAAATLTKPTAKSGSVERLEEGEEEALQEDGGLLQEDGGLLQEEVSRNKSVQMVLDDEANELAIDPEEESVLPKGNNTQALMQDNDDASNYHTS